MNNDQSQLKKSQNCQFHPALELISFCVLCQTYKCLTCLGTEPDDHIESCISNLQDFTHKRLKKSSSSSDNQNTLIQQRTDQHRTPNIQLENLYYLSNAPKTDSPAQNDLFTPVKTSELTNPDCVCAKIQTDTTTKVDSLISSLLQKIQGQATKTIPVMSSDENIRNTDLDSKQETEFQQKKSSDKFRESSGYDQGSSRPLQELKTKLSQHRYPKVSAMKKVAMRAVVASREHHNHHSESILQNSEPLPSFKYKVGVLPSRSETTVSSYSRAFIIDTLSAYAPRLVIRNPRNGKVQLDFKITQTFLTTPNEYIQTTTLPSNWEDIIAQVRRECEKWDERNKEINYFFTNATEKIKKILQMRLDDENLHESIIQTIKSIQLIDKDTLNLWATEFQNCLFRFGDVHHIRLICVSWTNDVVTEFNRKFSEDQLEETFSAFENNPYKRQQYENDLEQLINCVEKLPIKTPFMWGLLVSISICYQIQSVKTWDFLQKLGDKLFSKNKEHMTFKNIIGLPQEIKTLASCYKKLEGELSKYNENTKLEEIKPQLISFVVFTLYKQRRLCPIIEIPLPESVKEAKRFYLEKKYSQEDVDPVTPREGFGIIPEKREIYNIHYGVSK